MLKIGELAERSGVSVETLRYYEKAALLPSPHRGINGYRYYATDNIDRVNFILRAKALGFSLADIRDLLSLQVEADAHTCTEVKALAETKLAEIDAKLTELQRMRQALSTITVACCGGPHAVTDCTILTALAEGEVRQEHHDPQHQEADACQSSRHKRTDA
ncbi:Zn(2+)-responsive transcriptional regulator [Halomonas sp. WWR20]